MAGVGNGNGRMMSEINVTPFVDVMLVLLIIFMVTAPMMTEGVDVDLPKAKTGQLPYKEEQLIVSVDKEQNIYINKDKVKLGFLKEMLVRRLGDPENPRPVYLRADQDINYGYVVRVMAIIREAGVKELGMVTEPADIEMENSGGNTDG